jgi:hypothetical protein
MSRKTNNVYPDHFKLAGRNRQGENIAPDVEKQKFATLRRRARRRRSKP